MSSLNSTQPTPLLFSEFAQVLSQIEAVSARLSMTEILATLFSKLHDGEIEPTCFLLQGRLVPLYHSMEFQLSHKMVLRSLARIESQLANTNEASDLVMGATVGGQDQLFADPELEGAAAVEQRFKKTGDIGETAAQTVRTSAAMAQPSLLEVFDQLQRIAQSAGVGSQETKLRLLTQLLLQLEPLGAKYVTRIVVGKLRLGFSVMTMIDALSWAVVGDKSERDALEDAYNRQADIGRLARQYLGARAVAASQRQQVLDQLSVQWGIPVMPALCQRLNTAVEIVDKLGEVLAEPKYDGMRVQVHFRRLSEQRFEFQVFTRSLDNITHMFPELNAELAATLQCQACILDGEAIGFDPQTGELLPFQDTITRRRKHQVTEKALEIPMRFYLFDLLWHDGQSLINKKLRDRKDLLDKLILKNEVFLITPYIITHNPSELHTYHENLLTQKLEGAVLKRSDSEYVSGRKGWAWVKIKESEGTTGKLSDTLDLIVLGYYNGQGKRAQFGLGALLLGTLDQQSQRIQTVAKLGTGMTEDQLVEIKKLCDSTASQTQPAIYDVPPELLPDVWCQPQLVVEVAADEITNSPRHTAGVALRFPRLVSIRADKTWEDVTDVTQIRSMQ